MPNKRIAIVCDWLTGIGGAERVVLELHNLYPDAPIYTSQYSPDKIDWFSKADVRTGWLQKIPATLKKFLPVLRAIYFSGLDLSEYDIVISVTGAEAKAIKFGSDKAHVCYCNAPTHYYWSRYEEYLANPGFPKGFNWLAKIGLRLLAAPLRRWDYRAAQKPSLLIANSTHIASQIRKYYDRDSTVVFPPVGLGRFDSKMQRGESFITIGRQTPYKKIDLIVQACTDLGLPLLVVGNGPDHDKLLSIAGPTIRFETGLSDEQVADELSHAKAFIYAGIEDFGIVMVEALASGNPVIAYRAGGAKDIVQPEANGVFFDEQSVVSLTETLRNFDARLFDRAKIMKSATKFSTEEFRKNISSILEKY